MGPGNSLNMIKISQNYLMAIMIEVRGAWLYVLMIVNAHTCRSSKQPAEWITVELQTEMLQYF